MEAQSISHEAAQLCQDINRIGAWLAQDDFDDFERAGLSPQALSEISVIALLGNQVIATLTAACILARKSPAATLLFSGGAGHSTHLLYDNLRLSNFGGLVRDGHIKESMAEAEMYEVVAQAAFGIPSGRILVEKQSRNAAENASLSLRALKDANCPHGAILILQDPTMQRRSMLTWARQAEIAGNTSRTLSHAVFAPTVEPAGTEISGKLRFIAAQAQGTWTMGRFLALILGEIQRLHDDENGYGPNGKNFLPHVDIPEAVYESYLRVAASPLAALAVR
jgi:uncharacterized SAM-binding protein YcdF (DUF218 family)